jgi:hypothetical protein
MCVLDVVRATCCYPRASHVQYLIYFWNIQMQQLQRKKTQMRHLKQASETPVKMPKKHLKTIANICNIKIKYLQTYVRNTWKYLKHMLATCMYMQHLYLLLQHPDKTLATFVWNRNIWNICETYEYSHYNMWNISIYFCNIDIQYLQHTSEISETLNILLQHALLA